MKSGQRALQAWDHIGRSAKTGTGLYYCIIAARNPQKLSETVSARPATAVPAWRVEFRIRPLHSHLTSHITSQNIKYWSRHGKGLAGSGCEGAV